MKKIIYIMVILSGVISALAFAQSIDIYAHRGFRAISPENTLPAYTDALRMGVDVIDADINITKDNVLVVTHDLTLNPDITKDKNGKWIKKAIPIKDLTLSELETYDVGSIKPNSKLASLYPNHVNMKNVHIPTLEKVIKYLKYTVGDRVRLQIEIKTDPTKPNLSESPIVMANALYKVLKKTNMISNVEVQAFEWKALVELQKLDPSIKTAYLTDHTTEPMNKNSAKKIQNSNLWTAPLKASNFNYNYPKMVKNLGGTFWEPYELDLTKTSLAEAHKLGLKVVTWGWAEDEKTDFNYPVIQKLITWGVDGIITDRPDILRGLEAANTLVLPPSYPNTPYYKNISKF